MNDELIYSGKVENGKILFQFEKILKDVAEYFDGKNFEIIVRKKKNRRSIFQNGYYFGVCVTMVQRGMNDLGWKITKEETHEFLKDKFLRIELISEQTGQIISVPGSSRKLTTTEFMEYIADTQQFASEELSVVIPDPGEQTEINLC
jgi:predicted anti-sigma-YlaC factor YlaD